MDYFYLSDPRASKGAGAKGMSTKELQKRLREMGRSERGSRPVLVRRYEREISHGEHGSGDAGDEPEAERATAHASEHPMMVMVDESTGNKYMISVDHKGLSGDSDHRRLIKDMHQELKSWGYPGGAQNALSHPEERW